jgi:hypothetical protein
MPAKTQRGRLLKIDPAIQPALNSRMNPGITIMLHSAAQTGEMCGVRLGRMTIRLHVLHAVSIDDQAPIDGVAHIAVSLHRELVKQRLAAGLPAIDGGMTFRASIVIHLPPSAISR